MATQIYCTKTDIEAIWPAATLLASVDDDTNGSLSATELGYIDRAIERAANFINARLEMRYALADLRAIRGAAMRTPPLRLIGFRRGGARRRRRICSSNT